MITGVMTDEKIGKVVLTRACFDTYKLAQVRDTNLSLKRIFGVISSEIKKQHTKDAESMLMTTLFGNLFSHSSLKDLSKDDFLLTMGTLYDSIKSEKQYNNTYE